MMSLVDVVAALLFVGVLFYALFGGADFGSGVWDLLALDRPEAPRLRNQIDRSIGPVWEANHVWLIFAIVVFWTGFPRAFGPVMETLYVHFLTPPCMVTRLRSQVRRLSDSIGYVPDSSVGPFGEKQRWLPETELQRPVPASSIVEGFLIRSPSAATTPITYGSVPRENRPGHRKKRS